MPDQIEMPFGDARERKLTATEERDIAVVGQQVSDTVANTGLDMRTKLNNFNVILNRKPLAKLVRRMEQGQKYDYLPIRYYERLLSQLYFGRFNIEVRNYGNIFNELHVHVRVHYCHPVTGEWQYVDGLAAHQIMQDSGTKVSEFALYKKPNALKTVLPACYSESVKNALKKLGPIFGGDLNRKVEDDYDVFKHTATPVNR